MKFMTLTRVYGLNGNRALLGCGAVREIRHYIFWVRCVSTDDKQKIGAMIWKRGKRVRFQVVPLMKSLVLNQ